MTDKDENSVPEINAMDRLRAETHFQRARGYHRTGRFEDALAAIDEALAADPAYIRAHAARGHTLRRLGRLDEAMEVVDRVLAQEPDNAISLATKGTLLQEIGRTGEAREIFERALSLVTGEERSLIHYNFACYWATADDEAACRENLAQALQLDPTKKSVAAVDRDFQKYAGEDWFLDLTAL